MMKKDSGQTTLEFILSFSVVVISLIGVASLYQYQWKKIACLNRLFEAVHAELTGSKLTDLDCYIGGRKSEALSTIQILETPDRVVGIAHCSGRIERLELPKLEAAKWKK